MPFALTTGLLLGVAALGFAAYHIAFIRALLTVLVVIVGPGFVLSRTLFPEGDLGLPELAAVTLGTGVALIVLGGQLLNLTPWGLQTSSWLILVACLTLLPVVIGLVVRRRQTPPRSAGLRRPTVRSGQALMLLGAVFLVGGAIAVSRVGFDTRPNPGFTQMWMLPTAGRVGADIGIKSLERETAEFSLEVTWAGSPGRRWHSIVLSPGAEWRTSISLPAEVRGRRIDADLYLVGDPGTSYRHVVMWARPPAS